MKKSIAIDMDEVLADFITKELDIYEKEFGIRIKLEDLHGKELYQAVDPLHKDAVLSYPYRKGFFADLEVMPGSKRVITELQKKYEVFVVTAATEFPNSLKDKFTWLNRHFPSIGWQYVVFCGYKSVIHTDYLLDDRPSNLKTFSGHPLLFSAPHNLEQNTFERLNNWEEVGNYFL